MRGIIGLINLLIDLINRGGLHYRAAGCLRYFLTSTMIKIARIKPAATRAEMETRDESPCITAIPIYAHTRSCE